MATSVKVTFDVEFDSEGFMVDPDAWTEGIASQLATEEGITALAEGHWTVINFVREWWKNKGESPTLRTISKQSGVNTKELYALFPKGPAKKVARIAGLGKPKGCI